MSYPKFKHTVDGCDYTVEVMQSVDCMGMTTGGADVIWVYDAEGNKIADAEWDSACETVVADYFDEEDGRLDDHSAWMPDLYRKGWREVATWLVSTHPHV
jgi:hypothetical protein